MHKPRAGFEAAAVIQAARAKLFCGRGRPPEIGGYSVHEVIGRGAMGTVYTAYDATLDRKVAVKVLRADGRWLGSDRLRRRWLREARAVAKVTHPNVVQVYDAGRAGDEVYIALELVEGCTLTQWLAREPRTWREVVEVFRQAARGLAAAHAVGLVHRDFKPDNVLVGRDGRVRVADFGLALFCDADAEEAATSDRGHDGISEAAGHDQSRRTLCRAVIGTPAYMAPEQIRGDPVDAKTDQFGFCVALHEGLFGTRPFAGRSHRDLFDAVLEARIEKPPAGHGIPRWLRRVVLRGLSVDPSKRFRDITELSATLDHSRRRQRHLQVTMVGALAVLLGAAHSRGGAGEATCSAGVERASAVWGAGRKQAIYRRFQSLGADYASASWGAFASEIDDYVADWTERRKQECEAAPSSRVLECLDDRMAELDAVVTTLDHADVRVLRRLQHLRRALGPIESCGQTLPGGFEESDQTARLRLGVLRARVYRLSGAYEMAKNQLRDLDVAEEAPKWPARVAFESGLLHYELGELGEAERELAEALAHARRSSDRVLETDILITLAAVVGGAGRVSEGRRWAELASASFAAGGNAQPSLEGKRLAALGQLLLREGRYDQALVKLGGALDVLSRTPEPNRARLTYVHHDLATTLRLLQRFPEAMNHAVEAVAITREALGATHPAMARALAQVGHIELMQSNALRAALHYRAAIDIADSAHGPDHPLFAKLIMDLGRAESELGHHDLAVALMRRSVSLHERSLGSEHADTGLALANLGRALTEVGTSEEAEAVLLRSSNTMVRALGPNHPRVAAVSARIAQLLLELGRLDDAASACDRAIAIVADMDGHNDDRMARLLEQRARVAAERGRPRAARSYRERADSLAGRQS